MLYTNAVDKKEIENNFRIGGFLKIAVTVIHMDSLEISQTFNPEILVLTSI